MSAFDLTTRCALCGDLLPLQYIGAGIYRPYWCGDGRPSHDATDAPEMLCKRLPPQPQPSERVDDAADGEDNESRT